MIEIDCGWLNANWAGNLECALGDVGRGDAAVRHGDHGRRQDDHRGTENSAGHVHLSPPEQIVQPSVYATHQSSLIIEGAGKIARPYAEFVQVSRGPH